MRGSCVQDSPICAAAGEMGGRGAMRQARETGRGATSSLLPMNLQPCNNSWHEG